MEHFSLAGPLISIVFMLAVSKGMGGYLLISSSDWNLLCILNIASHLIQRGGLDKKTRSFGVRQTRVGIPTIPHHRCVALSKSLYFSGAQFTYL